MYKIVLSRPFYSQRKQDEKVNDIIMMKSGVSNRSGHIVSYIMRVLVVGCKR